MINTISLGELDRYFVKIKENQFDNRFIDRCVIGRGAGSIICKAIDTKMQNKWIALKMYNKLQMREQYRMDVARQVQILFSLQGKQDSKNIVEVYEAYKIEKSFGSEYCLALELCQQSLYDYIRKQEYRQVPYLEKVKICLKVSQGIRFLHQNSIIHRDLKPGNVLIKEKNGELVYLIADFGQSKVFQFGVQNSILRGTVIYSNPNALQQTNYSVEPDVFSLALTMIQILADGKSLFNTESVRNEYKLRQLMQKQLADVDKALNDVPKLREEMKYLLRRCLSQTKITVQEVCSSLSYVIDVMAAEQKYEQFQKMEVKAFSKKQHDKMYQQQNHGQQGNIAIQQQQQVDIMRVEKITTDSENKNSKQVGFSKKPGKIGSVLIDKQEEKKNERLSTKESDENISKIDSILKESVITKQETGMKKKISSLLNASEKDQTSLQMSKSDINDHSESIPSALTKPVRIEPISIEFGQNATQISSHSSWFPHEVDVSWIHRKSNTRPVVNANKMVFAKKVLCVQEGIKKKCDSISQSIVMMQNLKKYKQKLLKLKAIQNSNLEPNEKCKLMLICLKQLISQVKTELKQLANPDSKKKYENYMESLKVHYKKIHENFMAHYSRSQFTERELQLIINSQTLSQFNKEGFQFVQSFGWNMMGMEKNRGECFLS